jgi:hypothetical protein
MGLWRSGAIAGRWITKCKITRGFTSNKDSQPSYIGVSKRKLFRYKDWCIDMIPAFDFMTFPDPLVHSTHLEISHRQSLSSIMV